MDSPCLLALARVGMAVIPPDLREQVRALQRGDLPAVAAEAVVADVDRVASILEH